MKLSSITLLFLGLWLGGVWVYPPLYGLLICAMIALVLSISHFGKPISKTSRLRSLLSNFPLIFLLPLGAFTAWQGFVGRLTPSGEIVDLNSPFDDEHKVCILSGGLSPLLNFHIFPSSDARDLGQRYAVDIIGKSSLGFRTVLRSTLNPKPNQVDQYAIYGKTVYAPCAGRVVEYTNNRKDQTIGGSDKVNTSGNGVVLHCGNHHIHMHHLQEGSVITPLGTDVIIGQKIGLIGNSGNTIEPHLHFHAETIVESGNSKIHGEPVHMRIEGKFLARGNCL